MYHKSWEIGIIEQGSSRTGAHHFVDIISSRNGYLAIPVSFPDTSYDDGHVEVFLISCPLVDVYIANWKTTTFTGKTHYFNGVFSIAMCKDQRVLRVIQNHPD